MKRVLIIAIAAALAAAAADATDFVNEKFEGSFPPPGWTTKYDGASWTQARGGPWGNYAVGAVTGGLGRATLMSYEFDLKANTKVYYGFHYRFFEGGYATAEADFYIAYLPPHSGNLVYWPLSQSGDWGPWRGWKDNKLNARVKAYWRVWVTSFWRWGGGVLMLDNVVISDEDPSAVSPASLGRVKAVFR